MIKWLKKRAERREKERQRQHELELAKIDAMSKVGVAFVSRLLSSSLSPAANKALADLKANVTRIEMKPKVRRTEGTAQTVVCDRDAGTVGRESERGGKTRGKNKHGTT